MIIFCLDILKTILKKLAILKFVRRNQASRFTTLMLALVYGQSSLQPFAIFYFLTKMILDDVKTNNFSKRNHFMVMNT